MAWKNFKRKLRRGFYYGKKESKHLKFQRLLKIFDQKQKKVRGGQTTPGFSAVTAVKYPFIQPSIVRSYWFNRFINVFIHRGQRGTTLKFLFRALVTLKAIYGRTPMVLLFEILENYRVPFRVIKARKAKRLNRVHLITWWKQYGQVLKWLRSSVRRSSTSAFRPWDNHLVEELDLLISGSTNSRLYQKRLLWVQLAAMGRVSSHYRWKFRPRMRIL